MISEAMLERLCAYFVGIIQHEGGSTLAAGGVADHVHLLIAMPTTRSVSEMVRDIKANSSRWLRETYPDAGAFAWQTGYGAFSVSDTVSESVIRYIENQAAHHRSVSFREEYVDFLTRCRIDFDPKWVFND